MTPGELRDIRKAAGLTQGELAQRLSVTRKTVVNWETARFAIPDDITRRMLASGLAPAPVKVERKLKLTRAYADYVMLRNQLKMSHIEAMADFAKWPNGAQITDDDKIQLVKEYPDILNSIQEK